MNALKKLLSISLLLTNAWPAFAQFPKALNLLHYGPYPIGFRTEQRFDSTRAYLPQNNMPYRPLLMHIWYPAKQASTASLMPYKTYIALETQREGGTPTDANQVDSYCSNIVKGYRQYAVTLMGDLPVSVHDILGASTKALHQAIPAIGRFPIIVYAPSLSKAANQNHIACEYLASHGYIIVSVGSAGQQGQTMTKDTVGIMAQVKDLAYITTQAYGLPNADTTRLGVFGYSWGAMASVIFQMRNPKVKALTCWDGSHEYKDYSLLKTVSDFNPARLTVPYLYFSNLNEDWSTFPFFHSIPTRAKHLFRLKQLEHAEFTGYWSFYASIKPGSSYSTEGYEALCRYTLAFFNAYVKGDPTAAQSLSKPVEANGYPATTITQLAR